MSAMNRGLTVARCAAVLTIGLVGVSCDQSTGLRRGPPVSELIVSGQNQVGVVGHQLADPVTVKVTDVWGTPIESQPVVFKVLSGGGTVPNELVKTSPDGEATMAWTLGTSSSENQVLQVQVIDEQSRALLLITEVHATAQPGNVSSLQKTAGDNQTATVGTAVAVAPAVKAVDQYGNPVSGVDVVWRVVTGGGTIAGGVTATSKTDASGAAVAPGAWKLGPTAGANTLTGTIAGVVPATFFASGLAEP